MNKLLQRLCLLFMGRRSNPFVSYFDMGNDAPAPDPNIGIAAANNAAISKEALDFNKQMYEDNKPRQAATDALVKQVVDAQLAISQQNQQQAADQWDRFKTTFAPIEDKVASDAMNIDSEGELARAAGEAGANVQKQFENAKAQRDRSLVSMGVNPFSGKALVADRESQVELAGTKAAAQNNARLVARDRGISLRAGAANFGRNMPNTAANAYGTAITSGNSSVGNQESTIGC